METGLSPHHHGDRALRPHLARTRAAGDNAAARTVQLLGLQLDHGIFPEVFDGGFVAPIGAAVPQCLGAEIENVGTRPVPFTPGTSTPPSGASSAPPSSEAATRTSGAAPSVECSSIRARYEDELDSVRAAYPGTRIWHDKDGMWLLSESSIVEGLDRAATLLTAFSWSDRAAKAWGFWRDSAVSVRWIGPRHTNFPDGSICAFDPTDGAWAFGDSVVVLLDLYSVWALRHLHLELFHRWPGPQAVFHPYERRLEFHGDESCGCGSGRLYRDCCGPRDAARGMIPDAVSFTTRFAGGLREPPPGLAQVALYAAEPPSIASIRWK